jgi:hypothetical protein
MNRSAGSAIGILYLCLFFRPIYAIPDAAGGKKGILQRLLGAWDGQSATEQASWLLYAE